jgi:NTE family protein
MNEHPLGLLPRAPGEGRGDLTADLFEALASCAEQRVLRRGDVLVRQGEPADALHFILTGRFTVHVDGREEPIAELAQGEPVGEIGFFADLPRTATVVALRDSTVLTIGRAQYDEMSRAFPRLKETLIVALARRLAAARGEPAAEAAPRVRTLAVIAAGGSRLPTVFLDRLREVFGSAGAARFLTEGDVRERFPGVPLDDASVLGWLNALEAEAEIVVYIDAGALSAWTEKCLRQADTALLVAEEGASVEVNPSERAAFALLPAMARRLVILHRARTRFASGAAAWLRERDVFMHHHVALADAADLRRLRRFLTGAAAGFVAGAGGPLGSAHVGVYKAFHEAGVAFDILGGTSAGAAMAAAFACGAEPERVDRGTHNIFVRSRAFRRPTLPRYALIDHKAFDRALQAEFGSVLMEDLWIPLFTVSSNLSTFQPTVHRRGPVWQAVRASASIPGVLPPFFTSDGEMLVDGALMAHVPLGVMKRLKAGPNVVVSFDIDGRRTYPVDYAAIPGPVELAAAMLNPFARGRLPDMPGIVQVLTLSMLANRRPDPPVGPADLLLRPEIPANLGWASWERHSELFMRAYREAAATIRALEASGDPCLSSLLYGAG